MLESERGGRESLFSVLGSQDVRMGNGTRERKGREKATLIPSSFLPVYHYKKSE
jgi:hypothetical protein